MPTYQIPIILRNQLSLIYLYRRRHPVKDTCLTCKQAMCSSPISE